MKKLLSIIVLCVAAVSVLQAATTIPIASRVNYWTPGTYTGYTGGIPTNRTMFCNVKVSIPGTNRVAMGDGVTDDSEAISTAFKLAGTNTYVYLPAGVYRLFTNIVIQASTGISDCNYVTIKGDGSNTVLYGDFNANASTQKRIISGGQSQWTSGGFNSTPGNFVALSSDAVAGTYSVTLTSLPGSMVNGGMIVFDELNDGVVVSSTRYDNTVATAYNTDQNGLRNHTYTAVITNITGNTVSFTPPIPSFGFSVANSARVFTMSVLSGGTRARYKGLGFDSLTFALNTNNANCTAANQGRTIELTGFTDFYMQNCYFTDCSRFYLMTAACANFSVVSNFFGRQFGAAAVDVAYGLNLTAGSGFQIENNIFVGQYIPIILANMSRTYMGYNFFYDILTQGGTGTQGAEINCNHGAYCYDNLIEGNLVGRVQADLAHGTSGNTTVHGNYITGTGLTVTQNRYAVSFDRGSWSNTVTGNVLGYTNMDKGIFSPTNASFTSSSNVIIRLGYPFIGNNFFDDASPTNVTHRDLTVTNTVIYHANFDHVNNAYIYDPSYSSSIPLSMIYSSRPSWYGGFGWPPFGPNGYGGVISNLIPAQARFFGLNDPLLGLGSSRPGLMPLY